MTKHEVLIAGGGPTGLMLAGELALAGVDVAIVERRSSQALAGSRAGGLHSRTLEVLDQRGLAERFLSQGKVFPAVRFHIRLDISDCPTRHNYVLQLWQNHVERILAEWVGELEVPIYRGRSVTGFAQDDRGVDVALADGRSLRAEYLVGCDGGHSVIRKAAGIAFVGSDPTTSWLIAEAELGDEPKWRCDSAARGVHAIGKIEDGGAARIVLSEAHLQLDSEPTLQEVREALRESYGTDYGIHSPTWISRFTDMTRQAATYRSKRVLLAGDAAHVHPPMGGQGLNIGVQDAVNLGWKLALVVKRSAPDSLLDTYHAERFPIAARVLHNTLAQTALRRTDDRAKALAATVAELLGMDEPRRRFAAEISGLGVRYDFGEGHPLLGRRMPDLDLVTADGPTRVFRLLHDARSVLLNLGEPGAFDITAWSDRVRLVDTKYGGTWELPAIGRVAGPTAALIRADGYVAWLSATPPGPRLAAALTTWFGPPRAGELSGVSSDRESF